jgi:hypothetical protein
VEATTPLTATQEQILFLALLPPRAAALECATLTSVAQADLAAAAVHAVLLLAVPEIPRQLLPAKVITAVQALLTVAAVVVGRML